MIDALRAGWLYLKLLAVIAVIGAVFAIAIGGYVQRAGATWKAEYAQASPERQQWFGGAELTPQAEKRIGFKYCCSAAEQVDAHFKLTKQDGREHWQYRPKGEAGAWRDIPDDIVHWDEPGYEGHAVLFRLDRDVMNVPAGTLTCFFPPGGGT